MKAKVPADERTKHAIYFVGLIIAIVSLATAAAYFFGGGDSGPEQMRGNVSHEVDIPEDGGIENGINLLTLEDGTRCVVYNTGYGPGGISCDFSRSAPP